ncbi:MAG: autotransporter outer membrane beta-barrel domain-containing protein [Pseudomonadota bacterium]
MRALVGELVEATVRLSHLLGGQIRRSHTDSVFNFSGLRARLRVPLGAAASLCLLAPMGLLAPLGVLVLGAALTLTPTDAHAISGGCQAAGNGELSRISIFSPGGMTTDITTSAFEFEAGDQVTFTINHTSALNVLFTLDDATAGAAIGPVTVNVGATESTTYTIPADGPRAFRYFYPAGASSFTVIVSCPGQQQAAQAAITSSFQMGMRQTGGLIQNQVRKFTTLGGPSAAPSRGGLASEGQSLRGQLAATPGLLDFKAGRDASSGASAGASDPQTAASVFADVAWTRYRDTASSSSNEGHMVSMIVGGDYAVTEQFLVGGALSIERMFSDTGFNLGTFEYTGIGINPFMAYRIDDIFSTSLVGGFTTLSGSADRQNGTIQGSFVGNRWFAAWSGEGFWTWDNGASLLATLGVTYGEQRVGDYLETGGNFVGSSFARVGVASVGIQPGYLFVAGDDTFVEPYFRLQYDYEFTRTKIAGGNTEATRQPNDPDQMVFGLGMNLFSGPRVSANVEGTAVMLREEFSAYTLGARARYSF